MNSTIEEQEQLYSIIENIRQNPDAGNHTVQDQIQRLILNGKDLEWFQPIIPELVPGVQETDSWAASIREMLWSRQHWEQHNRVRILQTPDAPVPPPDRYHLRFYWPSILESLRPMSSQTLEAANLVYRVVAQVDCLHQDKNVPRSQIEAMDRRHNHFVVAAQVVLSTIVAPMIRELYEQGEKKATNDTRHKNDRELLDALEMFYERLSQEQVERDGYGQSNEETLKPGTQKRMKEAEVLAKTENTNAKRKHLPATSESFDTASLSSDATPTASSFRSRKPKHCGEGRGVE